MKFNITDQATYCVDYEHMECLPNFHESFTNLSLWSDPTHFMSLGILKWPPFSLPSLAEPKYMSHLQGGVIMLLQLGKSGSSGVAVFQTSQQVAKRN